jgi:hypothetical protein
LCRPLVRGWERASRSGGKGADDKKLGFPFGASEIYSAFADLFEDGEEKVFARVWGEKRLGAITTAGDKVRVLMTVKAFEMTRHGGRKDCTSGPFGRQ